MTAATTFHPSGENTRPKRRIILFVAEGEPNSIIAIENLDRLLACDLDVELETEIVNVFEDYHAALEHGVLVTPSLLLVDPPPRAMIVGTLQDAEKVLAAIRVRRSST